MKDLILPMLAVLALCGFKPALPLRHDTGPVHLTVIDRDSGQALTQYRQDGQRWIAGQQGHRYSVRLRNGSAERVLVVLSVDGLNAISGEVAAPHQTGYVLNPWQTTDIHGWRKSADEVAQFVFTDPDRSYAGRTGRPANIGVIGVAVFHEAGRVSWEAAPAVAGPADAKARPQARSSTIESARVTGSTTAPAPQLGTGHGQREQSRVRNTAFERDTAYPAQQVQVRYDSERNLVARGIIARVNAPVRDEPQAFPGQYVPDPPLHRRR
ncbi:hypothetical protein [Stenotrophomonas rhizophila]|uniref:Uncharacterized protein n=1 Tax=Stenotrophomonas rhizophila TaxID=216778 RepID=A0A7V8CEU7_9GAMM|nr:hypothetical protein [Stenotrophomonas rhizophila]KAB7630073.1 hypothetical protein F9K92_11340 [Stenotrophomonas rhizophila]